MALSETAQELIDATAAARETIREMHAATKDLRQAITEARRVIREELESDLSKRVGDVLDPELAKLVKQVDHAMGDAVRSITAEFDRLVMLAVGIERGDKQNLEQLVKFITPALLREIRRAAESDLQLWHGSIGDIASKEGETEKQ